MPTPLPAAKFREFKSSWDDLLGPSFALGAGAAAPSIQTFMAPTRLLTFNQGTEDNVDLVIQVPHDHELDVSTITLHPHVHWTCIASPAANALLYWQFSYTWAKPGLTAATAGSFYNVNTLTSTVNTLSGAEYRKHMVTDLPDINWPASQYAPSQMFVGNLRIGGDSTVADTTVALLSFDFHYLKGPSGTDTEYA